MSIPVVFGLRWFGSDVEPEIDCIERAMSYYVAARGLPQPQPEVLAINSTMPAIGYTVLDQQEKPQINASSGRAQTHFQFSCFDTSHGLVLDLVRDLRNYLQGLTCIVGGVQIDACWADGISSPQTILKEGSQKPYWYALVDYQVLHSIPIPTL